MTNCPNCGAPIDPHAEACAYCGTYYSTWREEAEIRQTAEAITFTFSNTEIVAALEALEKGLVTPKEARRYFAP